MNIPEEISALREALVAALEHADECARASGESDATRARAVYEAQRDANNARDAIVDAVRAVAERTREKARKFYRPTEDYSIPAPQYGTGAVALILDGIADEIEIAIGDQPTPRAPKPSTPNHNPRP